MSSQNYKQQVGLLLKVLPYVAQEECFALHGGTAINFFVRNMPRLSIDIDLTYLLIEDRQTTLKNIDDALKRIKSNIEEKIPDVQVLYKSDVAKLSIRLGREEIKLEVNLIKRGTIKSPQKKTLCDKAKQMYKTSCTIQVVPFGQLYGGKLCAALDRQHPRDLFDVKILLEEEGITDDVRQGFLLCLVSSNRPINEILVPNFQGQHHAMDNQFAGMSDMEFTYDEFEETREQLVKAINESLTQKDKKFLLSIKNCEPDWGIHDFKRFPAVQWKLKNLRDLKQCNPDKHRQLYEALKEKLD